MSDTELTLTPPADHPTGSGVLTASNGSGAQAGVVSLPSAAQKYVTAFILFANVALTPVAALLVGPFSWVAVWQYACVVASAVGSYLIPLLPSGWQGFGKTGVAILGAIFAAIIPVWTDTWDYSTILILAMAIVAAIGTELGVQFRTDQKVSTTVNAA
jgi:hypothetical protein